MKIVVACHGVRGDVEPSVVLGRELLRRGHDVTVAVPPNVVSFVETIGLSAVAWGADSQAMMDAQRDYWTCFFGRRRKPREQERLGREIGDIVERCFTPDAFSVLTSAAEGADLVIAGQGFEQFSANIAEYFDIPLVTVHFFPMLANGRVLPFVPPVLGRALMSGYERLSWSGAVKKVEDAQRRDLGLAEASVPWSRRIAERRSLEIQAYDEAVVPGLAAEWAKWGDLRPFVGTLTLESPTESEDEVAAWIAGGPPPIFFGFGSVPVESPADTIAMIDSVCAQLGERALVGAGSTDFGVAAQEDRVKIAGQLNYGKVFSACRAVVHHSGAGTIAACLRVGVPQLGLWTLPDQALRTTQLKRLNVGTGRRFSVTTEKTLIADLRRVLTPGCQEHARAFAPRMSTPAQAAAAAADRVEAFVRVSRR